MGSLFGGSKSKTETKTVPKLTDEQLSLLKTAIGKIEPQIGKGVSAYPGQYSAALTPEEQQYADMLKSTMANLPEAWKRAMNPDYVPYDISPAAAENFYEYSIKRPALKTYKEDILPQIDTKFRNQFWGTERMKAENKAGTDLAAKLASTHADLMYKEELARRQALQDALTRAIGAAGIPEELSKTLAGYGTAKRAIEQNTLEAKYKDWMRTRPEYSPYYKLALGFLGISPYNTVVTQTSGSSGLLGGLMQGAGFMLGNTVLPGIGGAIGSALGSTAAGGTGFGGAGRYTQGFYGPLLG